MAKVVSEGVGAFCHHYPRVVAIITAQAEGRGKGKVCHPIPAGIWGI